MLLQTFTSIIGNDDKIYDKEISKNLLLAGQGKVILKNGIKGNIMTANPYTGIVEIQAGKIEGEVGEKSFPLKEIIIYDNVLFNTSEHIYAGKIKLRSHDLNLTEQIFNNFDELKEFQNKIHNNSLLSRSSASSPKHLKQEIFQESLKLHSTDINISQIKDDEFSSVTPTFTPKNLHISRKNKRIR